MVYIYIYEYNRIFRVDSAISFGGNHLFSILFSGMLRCAATEIIPKINIIHVLCLKSIMPVNKWVGCTQLYIFPLYTYIYIYEDTCIFKMRGCVVRWLFGHIIWSNSCVIDNASDVADMRM